MTKKKISVKAAKAKGRKLQNWVGENISEITGRPFGKDQEIEGREMGQSGVDVKLYGEAQKLFPFSVECENAQRWTIHDKIKQAKENQKKGTDWLCFFKRNQEKAIAVMDGEAFFKLYNSLLRLQETINGHLQRNKRGKK